MQVCRVVGSTVSTAKAPGLADFKLLNVGPDSGEGPAFVAVDRVGAGVGDIVLVATGSAARGSSPRAGSRSTRRSWRSSTSPREELVT